MYLGSSENKGADHLHGHCEADLHLCFRCAKKGFLMAAHFKADFCLYFSIYSVRTVYQCGLIEKKHVQCAVQRFKRTIHSGGMDLQVHIFNGINWATTPFTPAVICRLQAFQLVIQHPRTNRRTDKVCI